jgi:diadenosine tetraphosphate (Ap4A) HIT family hydrolase
VNFLPRHEVARDGRFAAGLNRFPTTPDQCTVIVEGANDIFNLSSTTFVDLMSFTRTVSRAVAEVAEASRRGLASDGSSLHIIPLHDLESDWKPIIHSEDVYYDNFPGFLSSKNGLRMSTEMLNHIQNSITIVSDVD